MLARASSAEVRVASALAAAIYSTAAFADDAVKAGAAAMAHDGAAAKNEFPLPQIVFEIPDS